jgi:hypothetical protein
MRGELFIRKAILRQEKIQKKIAIRQADYLIAASTERKHKTQFTFCSATKSIFNVTVRRNPRQAKPKSLWLEIFISFINRFIVF